MNDKEKYLNSLYKAAEWGLDDNRQAWLRTIAFIELEFDKFSLEDLINKKHQVREKMPSSLKEWFNDINERNPDPALFKVLENSPENIWKGLTCINQGVFAIGSDPLTVFLILLYSRKDGIWPLQITPQLDGWGIPLVKPK